MSRPKDEQVNDPRHPLKRHAGAPAPHTRAYRQDTGTNAGIHREDGPYTTNERRPKRVGYAGQALQLDPRQQSLASAGEDEDEYDDPGTTRLPSSARRYPGAQTTNPRTPAHHALSPIPQRRSRPQEGQQALINNTACVYFQGAWHPVTQHKRPVASPFSLQQAPYPQIEEHAPLLLSEPEDQPQRQRPLHAPRFHWLLWVGLFLCTMLLGYIVLTSFSNWLQVKRDDLLYGRPRTFQIDAVVGHSDSESNPSHFQCMNLNKRIQVIEFPGGNASKAKLYEGPTLVGQGAELTVCTLSFRDVNGDGKPDMILSIGGEIFVMINDGSGFRNVRQGEHFTM